MSNYMEITLNCQAFFGLVKCVSLFCGNHGRFSVHKSVFIVFSGFFRREDIFIYVGIAIIIGLGSGALVVNKSPDWGV